MPEQEEILERGREWYRKLTDDAVLPLNFTDASLENVQTLLDTLPDDDPAYRTSALVGLATYLADYFCQLFPDYHPEVTVIGKEIEEVSATKEGGWQVNFLSWLIKAQHQPEDHLPSKFRAMIEEVSEKS